MPWVIVTCKDHPGPPATASVTTGIHMKCLSDNTPCTCGPLQTSHLECDKNCGHQRSQIWRQLCLARGLLVCRCFCFGRILGCSFGRDLGHTFSRGSERMFSANSRKGLKEPSWAAKARPLAHFRRPRSISYTRFNSNKDVADKQGGTCMDVAETNKQHYGKQQK